MEGPVVVQNLLAQEDTKQGYNAQTGEYVNMMEAGIIDALKVTKTALVDAASVASLLATTEVVITDIPEPKGKGGADMGMGGGMGGGMGMGMGM